MALQIAVKKALKKENNNKSTRTIYNLQVSDQNGIKEQREKPLEEHQDKQEETASVAELKVLKYLKEKGVEGFDIDSENEVESNVFCRPREVAFYSLLLQLHCLIWTRLYARTRQNIGCLPVFADEPKKIKVPF